MQIYSRIFYIEVTLSVFINFWYFSFLSQYSNSIALSFSGMLKITFAADSKIFIYLYNCIKTSKIPIAYCYAIDFIV